MPARTLPTPPSKLAKLDLSSYGKIAKLEGAQDFSPFSKLNFFHK
jgi:hypothetical protein